MKDLIVVTVVVVLGGALVALAGAVIGALAAKYSAFRILSELRSQRPHSAFPKLPKLTSAEARAALAVGEDHPLWRAVHQCIETQREAALLEVCDPDTQKQAHLMHYYAGAAAHLQSLADFLASEREEALKGGEEGEE